MQNKFRRKIKVKMNFSITPQEIKYCKRYFQGKTPEEQEREQNQIIEHVMKSFEEGDGNVYIESRCLNNFGEFYFPQIMNSELLQRTSAYRVTISDCTDYELGKFQLDSKNRVCAAKIHEKKRSLDYILEFNK